MPNPKPRGSFNSTEALPVTPAEVTAEWCSRFLGRSTKNVTIVDIIHGTSSKIILEITYDEERSEKAPTTQQQQRICLKGGFNPQLVAIHPALKATYRREAEFYYHIAPSVAMRLPRAWYCGSDTVNGQGIVAMDDLTVSGCTFGTPATTWSVERVRAGVEQLAALHAKTWNATPDQLPWLSGGGGGSGDSDSVSLGAKNPFQGIILSLLSPAAWDLRFGTAADERSPIPIPDDMADRERLTAAFATLWKTTDPRFECVVHGDPHIGNTFITAAGEPGFIDWQGLHVGSAFHDVSYFVTGALTIEDRRRHEEDLVSHYLVALARMGGPELRREVVWNEYRKNMLCGIAWTLATPQMQPRDNVFAMAGRHVAAIEDHRSLELLESLPEYKRETS